MNRTGLQIAFALQPMKSLEWMPVGFLEGGKRAMQIAFA